MTPWTVAYQAPLWDFPGKNTGVSCHVPLQGIFLTQGSNQCLRLWLLGFLSLSNQESPNEHLKETAPRRSFTFSFLSTRINTLLALKIAFILLEQSALGFEDSSSYLAMWENVDIIEADKIEGNH